LESFSNSKSIILSENLPLHYIYILVIHDAAMKDNLPTHICYGVLYQCYSFVFK